MEPDLEPHPPDVEILDDDNLTKEQIRAFADSIAHFLDTLIRIPGTPIRIGLDPLLGLIPVLGDLVSNLIGSTILLLALQLQVPKVVILRMAANIGINTMIGGIPGIGDLFSIWFRSNVKNVTLLRRYTRSSTSTTTIGDWVFVSLLICTVLALALGFLALLIFAFRSFWNLF